MAGRSTTPVPVAADELVTQRPARRRTHSGARARVATTGDATVLGGRYALRHVIGHGGMATVYWAEDTTLNRPVAVKLLHPHLCREPRFVEQFLQMELRVARLFHPNLVTILDAGQADEGCYVVMEYAPGGSLGDLVATRRLLPIPDAVEIVAQVADALQLLHSEGIVHADVKPDNILLDDDGKAKLADFGIAHLATTTGAVDSKSLMGSAPYLAPEQLEAGRADARSDLYSLGLVTYELLAGKRPFGGGTWVAVATQRLARDPAPLAQLRPDIPPELERVVMRALARDPARRYDSAAHFRDGLLAALEPTPAPSVATAPVPSVDDPAADTAPLVRRPANRAVQQAVPSQRAAPIPIPTRWRQRLRPEGLRRLLPPPESVRSIAHRVRDLRSHPRALLALALLGALVALLVLPLLVEPPRPVPAPDLAGRSVDEARGLARAAGLGLSVAEEPSETVARGVVIRQEPAPGATIQSDQSVRVVVSSGRPPVKVPDLQQRRLDDARGDLAAVGLTLGKVEEREIARQPWGVVIRQAARSGSELERGSAVDVTVATPPWTSVPNVVDRALGDAESTLDKRGLKLGSVRLEPRAGKRAGTVLAQEPTADVRLRQGEAVAVTIAVPPEARP